MPELTLQDSVMNDLVELLGSAQANLDTPNGEEVWLESGILLNVQCTNCPGFIQVKIMSGGFEGRIALLPRDTRITV